MSWKAASEDLVETWPLLRTIAIDWPGGPVGDPAGWAATPEDLAGAGAQITQLFTRNVPTQRLLVLGRPGAGKTVLLLRLLLGLLAQRASDESDCRHPAVRAVPVLFPLASWNPARQDLYAWMADRLAADYRGLARPAPARYGPVDRARALLDHHLILPILDGFDEIPFAVRGTALSAINQALPLGQAVVLSSRVAEYRDALRPASGVPVKLAGTAGIELCPLSAADATAYLQRDAGGTSEAADRWATLTTQLGTPTPVGEALRTPLMLFLARTIYNPRPGERAADLPHPAELCDTSRFPTRAAVETQLFSAFIPAAYRLHPRYPCRWTPRQAQVALTFLARHLQHTLHGTPDLAWWQLHRAVRATIPLLISWPIALLAGSGLGIFAAIHTVDDAIGVKLGNAIGAFVGGMIIAFTITLPLWLTFETEGRQPAAKVVWVRNWPWLAVSLSLAVLTAMMGASAPAVVMTGLGTGIATGVRVGSADPAVAVGPRALWARDRRVFWQLTLVTAAVGLGPAAVIAGVSVVSLWVGLGIGVWLGSGIAFSSTAWGRSPSPASTWRCADAFHAISWPSSPMPMNAGACCVRWERSTSSGTSTCSDIWPTDLDFHPKGPLAVPSANSPALWRADGG
ncbi:NACHT domain-containing protein [Streptomyces telluris]|uniref:NACHT domain-containing protein n=1 Tax=Streptomyces telluris TaxID=2720021 RepID=A0A9X2LBJ0_9ACTN|nr:NACHT domain-containing protein [Streptomyces telluris]MCQ8768173.1 NACHT domain-containing protein [Streptomyces telluris]